CTRNSNRRIKTTAPEQTAAIGLCRLIKPVTGAYHALLLEQCVCFLISGALCLCQTAKVLQAHVITGDICTDLSNSVYGVQQQNSRLVAFSWASFGGGLRMQTARVALPNTYHACGAGKSYRQ